MKNSTNFSEILDRSYFVFALLASGFGFFGWTGVLNYFDTYKQVLSF